jgi:hypothetical protein
VLSDEAIQDFLFALDCFAALAMTNHGDHVSMALAYSFTAPVMADT